MENADVAQLLSEVADLLELTGGNQFKVRAYRQAAQIIELLPEPVSEAWRKGTLATLPNIGERIARHVEEILSTGSFAEHDQLMKLVPPGLLELLDVEGVGPRTAASVWKQLGVTTLAQFEEACRDGRVAGLPRFGQKRQAAILKAVERYHARQGRVPLFRALPTAEALARVLRKCRGVHDVQIAGSLRRRRETVGDIDLLVSSTAPDAAVRTFAQLPEVQSVLARGPTKVTVRLRMGLQADLRVLPPESFGAALHYFTGSKSHNIEVRTRAQRLGLKLSEYGVFDRHGKRLGGATEEEIFRAVGLPFIPPELREGAGELEAAEEGRLPHLVEEADLRGDLHVHSDASSDGYSDFAELRAEAARLGRAYLAITDHSRSRPLGLGAEALLEHAARIRAASKSHGPHLLAGVEVDILPDGSLDLPLEVLAELDWVVASVHAHFDDAPDKMTARLVRALRTGVVDVLGHPTGRQLGARDGAHFDLAGVLEVAREMGVAMEVNAMPDRLDLPDKAARQARDAGVPLVVDSDAHHASHLANLRYGVWVARRAWLEKGDVLNSRPLASVRRAHTRRRHPEPAGAHA